ncbi:hypothetical protein HDU67_000825 [Dinochytrium kinnereticum]|nr:hypothetical protein HDU67_000825 [Dinochytrium kinnereticum]
MNICVPFGITNGSKGVVVGWKEGKEVFGKKTLDVVYVHMKNIKQNLDIGLGQNVAAIYSHRSTIHVEVTNFENAKRPLVKVQPEKSM